MGDIKDIYKMEQQSKKGGFLKLFGFFAAGAILAIAVHVVYEKFFKKKEVLPPLDTTKPDYSKLLKVGVIAPKEVSFLQNYLNSKATVNPKSILPLLKVDGIFGSKTQERLFEFMKKNETTLAQLMAYGAQNSVQNMVSVAPSKTVM
jgi:hypothetical protein